jgi:hypothetical protein
MKKTEPHPGHDKHLCAMIEESGLTQQMKHLINNSKYVCTCCGRAAVKEENLCAPEPL